MTSVDAETSLISTSTAEEGPDFGVLAEMVRRIRNGRLDVRMPRVGGAAGEFIDGFNELITLLERRNRDLLRISRVVGREGRMLERLDEESYDGGWAHTASAVK